MEMNKQTSFIKVTVLQTDIVWEEAKVNRMAVEQLIEKHCDTDLFVLPEMFSTGFSMNPMEIAEDDEEKLCNGCAGLLLCVSVL